ncbi:30S ribosomal protein THX [Hymenobacter seoulensis]
MGKGDIKTKRGKRSNGSFGVHRKKKKAGKAATPKPTGKK